MFFCCALITILASVLGLIETISNVIFNPFDLIIFSYLTLFGIIMGLLDVPSSNPMLLEFRGVVYK